MVPGYARAEPEAAARVMAPYLAAARETSVTALVECSTIGVGRNVAVLQHLANTTPIHIVAPTGVYLTSRDFEDGAPSARVEASLDELLAGLSALAGALPSQLGPPPLAARPRTGA